MENFKVLTIVGTRPELIKLSCVIKELEQRFNHKLVHTGQNFDYELNEVFFEDFGLQKPDYYLDATGNTAAETIGLTISKVDDVLAKEQPDAVLFYGDTNSCLSVIAAKRRKIPVFHMEAGNRCFDQRVPEEINRKIIDHTSDINMTLTEHARRYLIAEGIRPETVIKVGSSMGEVLAAQWPKIEGSTVLEKLELEPQKYFLASLHREENVDTSENLESLLNGLGALAKSHNKKVIISTHPRTRKRLEEFEINTQVLELSFMKPVGFSDYVKLQMNASCVLSDSGTITEESSLLNFPAVNLRNAHERPEGMDEASVIMSGVNAVRIQQAAEMAMNHHSPEQAGFRKVADYDVDNVSKKVARIILSYTDYVNRFIWHKM